MAKEKDEVAARAAESVWDLRLNGKWEYADRPDEAVSGAVERWLDRNADRLIQAIARAVAEKIAEQ